MRPKACAAQEGDHGDGRRDGQGERLRWGRSGCVHIRGYGFPSFRRADSDGKEASELVMRVSSFCALGVGVIVVGKTS